MYCCFINSNTLSADVKFCHDDFLHSNFLRAVVSLPPADIPFLMESFVLKSMPYFLKKNFKCIYFLKYFFGKKKGLQMNKMSYRFRFPPKVTDV